MARPDPFDEALVEAVADEHGMTVADLRDLLERHQALFRFGERTVEDTVYEWRAGLPSDPVVARTDRVVYLDAPGFVWNDLLSWLELGSESEAATALRAAHARQFEADRGESADGAVVVARE